MKVKCSTNLRKVIRLPLAARGQIELGIGSRYKLLSKVGPKAVELSGPRAHHRPSKINFNKRSVFSKPPPPSKNPEKA